MGKDSEGEVKDIEIWMEKITEVWLLNRIFIFHARATTLADATCKHKLNQITFAKAQKNKWTLQLTIFDLVWSNNAKIIE